jgi:6-phosphofructokinase 1
MRKIGILTRDCAGVNACVRAIVRAAITKRIEPVGFFRGYDGLMENDCKTFDHRSVSGILGLGGTILKTARALRFKAKEGQLKAIDTIKKNNIDGLIIVGGNGSLAGANVLSGYGIKVIGVPATIDNDLNGIDATIGADTAINVALDAIDKIRDTATSLERIFVVEVMGRDCGYLALQVSLAGGCEEVILPELDFDIHKLCEEIAWGRVQGKVSWIIIVAEGKAKAADIAAQINKVTGLETREVVLGHVQRGGSPTAIDRILGARLGQAAVELLASGESNKCVGIKNGELITVPLKTVVKPKEWDTEKTYKLVKLLT